MRDRSVVLTRGTRGRADCLGHPGNLAVQQRADGLGGEVARSQPGAFGQQHDVAPTSENGTDRVLDAQDLVGHDAGGRDVDTVLGQCQAGRRTSR
jgi:hypothetical protein